MISVLNFTGAFAALVAFFLLLTPWRRRLSLEEKCMIALTCLITVLINAWNYASWMGLAFTAAPEENLGDFLQVLQPALWGMFFYVVVQTSTRRELQKSQQQMRSIVENMPVILHAYDEDGRLLAWNRHAEEVTGYSRDEFIGRQDALSLLFPSKEVQKQLRDECRRGGGEYKHRIMPVMCKQKYEKQVAWYNIANRLPIPGWANWGIGLDITDQLNTQRELEHRATHDDLTGLPNRALLRDRLTHALQEAGRTRYTGALMLLDLDHFKMVNDTHGHPVGDRLLYELGQRLRGCLKSTDMLARFGGDEFVLLLENIGGPAEAAMVAERVISAVTTSPFNLYGNEIRVSTSLGITIFPDDDIRIDELMKNVDLAMYAAKEAGRNGYHFYSREMHKRLRWQHQVSEQLRTALETESFELHYQPQLALSDKQLVGAEALLRWNAFDESAITPDVFIPIAENMGLMPVLGKWVVESAVKQAAVWQGQQSRVPVAINLSAVQFYQPDLLDLLLAVIEEQGLDPQSIEFEVTESAVMRNMDKAIATMKHLSRHGFGISLDDFGTGYSSLSYLKRFPVSKIKIDKSFVAGIESDPADAAIVRSVIDLGHSLNMKVLAEGVETSAQYQRLGDAGCDYVQGFYCSKPMPADKFGGYMAGGGRLN